MNTLLLESLENIFIRKYSVHKSSADVTNRLSGTYALLKSKEVKKSFLTETILILAFVCTDNQRKLARLYVLLQPSKDRKKRMLISTISILFLVKGLLKRFIKRRYTRTF